MSNILPVNRSKRSARRFYDRISEIYDWLTASEKGLIKKGVDLLSPALGETILEIGTGTGSGLKFISEYMSENGYLLGLDLSRKMLLKSKEKIKDIYALCSLVQGDGVNLPISRNFLDGVFCSFTLELFSQEEINDVLQEIQRALKSEGRLAVLSLSSEPRTLAERIYEIGHRLFPTMLDCRPIPLADLLEENGYEIQQQEILMNWGLPVQIVLCLITSSSG